MSKKTVGDRLLKLRGERRREEVAAAVGISSSALGKYEQGNRMPRDEIKVRLAKYYSVSVQELFFNP